VQGASLRSDFPSARGYDDGVNRSSSTPDLSEYLYPGCNALETAVRLSTEQLRMFRRVPREYDMLEAMKDVIARLEQAGIPFALIGGLAVGYHSIPRATKDVDFLVNEEDAERARQMFAGEYRGGMRDFLLFEHAGVRFDLVVTRLRWHRDALAQAKDGVVEGIPIRVVPARDLILLKLIASVERANLGAASQDRTDVIRVIEHNADLSKTEFDWMARTLSTAYGMFGPAGFAKYRRALEWLNETLDQLGRTDAKCDLP